MCLRLLIMHAQFFKISYYRIFDLQHQIYNIQHIFIYQAVIMCFISGWKKNPEFNIKSYIVNPTHYMGVQFIMQNKIFISKEMWKIKQSTLNVRNIYIIEIIKSKNKLLRFWASYFKGKLYTKLIYLALYHHHHWIAADYFVR